MADVIAFGPSPADQSLPVPKTFLIVRLATRLTRQIPSRYDGTRQEAIRTGGKTAEELIELLPLRRGEIMNVSRMLRWCLPVACLMAAGLFVSSAEAGPLVAQPNLTQAVAPATVGFHRWGYGYGSYRGWGSYYYGRPALYYSGYNRPYRSVARYNYRPAYSYGSASPYYVNSYSTPYCSSCSTGYSAYPSVSNYQPAVYTQPVAYSQPVYTQPAPVYAQPIYAQPIYAQPVYSSGYYARPVSYYSGYSSYSYPTYRSIGVSGGGYGYSGYSPYHSHGYYGGRW